MGNEHNQHEEVMADPTQIKSNVMPTHSTPLSLEHDEVLPNPGNEHNRHEHKTTSEPTREVSTEQEGDYQFDKRKLLFILTFFLSIVISGYYDHKKKSLPIESSTIPKTEAAEVNQAKSCVSQEQLEVTESNQNLPLSAEVESNQSRSLSQELREVRFQQLTYDVHMYYSQRIENWDQIRKGRGLTDEEQKEWLQDTTAYFNIIRQQKIVEEKERSAEAVQILARNSTEKIIFERTKAVFDYFENWETFVRYWSTCALLSIWMFCKLRGLAPTLSIPYIDNYFPWWVPRMMIPNSSFIIPVVIIGSLVIMLLIIFVTHGNTIASMLIFSIGGLCVLWSLESTTISNGIFSLLRLFSGTLFFCFISMVVFLPIYHVKNTHGILGRLWICIFTVVSIAAAIYIGYEIALTDDPQNLQSKLEVDMLNMLDKFIESIHNRDIM